MRRGGWLRRRAKPAPVIQADIWREGLGVCVVCAALGVRLAGRVDGHHVIPARVLRRLGLTEFLMDKRNRLALCREHHESHENRSRPVPRELLPACVFVFAEELGLGWYLDRHYQARDAAA